MMSDKDLTRSGTNRVSETAVTPSERRIEHRSVLQWDFTHQSEDTGRLGLEVGRLGHTTEFRLLNPHIRKQVGYILKVKLMSSSNDPVISVKIPILWDIMTQRQRSRLSRITSRDSRVIKAYLGVIERHESELLVGKKRKRLDSKKLTELTLTATQGKANRYHVEHDFKRRFGNISPNELQECCRTAVAMWESYLALGGSRPLQSSSGHSRKLPRFIFRNRFELVFSPKMRIRHWLRLRDSLDSVREGRRFHDSLMIPLSPSSYHLTAYASGDAKSVRLLKDRRGKWWVVFSVRCPVEREASDKLPPAVLAIDLGIQKSVCSVILTREGLRQVRYWTQKDKVQLMKRYDAAVASLQKKRNLLLNRGQNADQVKRKLRQIGDTRQQISIDHDRKLVSLVSSHIEDMASEYDLYVAIGRVKGIRGVARRGNFRGNRFRGMIHRWSFHRITTMLKHKLSLVGLDENRVVSVSESWTSIKCHKCGHKGLRPKQSYFICHTCGYRDNADKNGAINIGRRLIMLIPSLRDEKEGLGMWLLSSERSTPKTKRSGSSERMPSLPERLPASSEGESVADCNDQTSFEMFVSSADPAMARTVETPPAVELDGKLDTKKQRTEAGSRRRDNVPMRSNKGHVTAADVCPEPVGDNGRDKGGTQKSEVWEVHALD